MKESPEFVAHISDSFFVSLFTSTASPTTWMSGALSPKLGAAKPSLFFDVCRLDSAIECEEDEAKSLGFDERLAELGCFLA